MVQLLREQQEMMKEQWQNMETQRREMQAKMDALSAPKEAITDGQIQALEARLEVLHETKLLSDDALEQLEDILADFIALRASLAVVTMDHVVTNPVAGKVHQLVALSEGLGKDGVFARQARRKVCD